MMGDLSGRVCQREGARPRYVLIRRSRMGAWDALMVTGFDIIGQNRTLQIHWAKRVAAFALDCLVVLTPVWILLFLLGERRGPAYGGAAGVAVFVFATVVGGGWGGAVGETIAGGEGRAVGGAVEPREGGVGGAAR